MLYLPQLLTLAGVWALVVIIPGPNFVATVHHATARSRRDGLLAALGIATGTALWVTFSVVGLGVLFAHFSWLMEAIRTAGALYLTYLGISMIWNAKHGYRNTEGEGRETGENRAVRQSSAWRAGFLTDISNPKSAAFFGSLFAVFLPAHSPLWLQVASVVIVVLITSTWYGLVACLFSLAPVARVYRRLRRWVDLITGGILVALGVRLVVSK